MAEGKDEVSNQNASDGSGGEPGANLPEGLEPIKRGRGRPPNPNKGAGSSVNTTPKSKPRASGNEIGNSVESAQFVAKGFVGLIELVESFIHANCAAKIEKKFPEKLTEFKEMAKSVALSPKDSELMEKSAEKIAMKYDVLSKYGPEVVLSVVMLQYGARQLHLMKFVEGVVKEPEVKKTADSAGPGAPLPG